MTTETLRELSTLISNDMAAHVAVCEYSAEDNTPTLHIDLWRGHDLCDLPEAVAALVVASEGHWDGGRCYSLQICAEAAYRADFVAAVIGDLRAICVAG
jgi:hypothetical protein